MILGSILLRFLIKTNIAYWGEFQPRKGVNSGLKMGLISASKWEDFWHGLERSANQRNGLLISLNEVDFGAILLTRRPPPGRGHIGTNLLHEVEVVFFWLLGLGCGRYRHSSLLLSLHEVEVVVFVVSGSVMQ